MFGNLFGGGAATLADSITGGLDKLFTSDEERLQWEAKKEEVKATLQIKLAEMELALNDHLSKRHETDMQSDSWLSKNIRPLALIHFLLAFDGVVFLAYLGYPLEAAYLAVIESALQLGLMFYFGGRSLEKGVKMVTGVLGKKK